MSEYRDAIIKISEDLGQNPRLWEKDTFDNFEVGTCEILEDIDGSQVIERHDEDDRRIDMYTVYGHYPHDRGEMRGVDALFDLDTPEEAQSIMSELEILTFGGAK